MNKQYVKDTIKSEIKELKIEYDEKISHIYELIDNVYQCPDCGAAAFRNLPHKCITPQIIKIPPMRQTIGEYIMAALPQQEPNAGVIDAGSIYTATGLSNAVIDAGCAGTRGAIVAELSNLARKKKIKRKAAVIRMASTGKTGKRYEREVSGFVYWRE